MTSADPPAPERTTPTGPAWRRWLSGDLRTGDEVRDAVYLERGDTAANMSRFWLLLVLSTAIATAGLIGDSTATVIGAMIVAPLATPIHGVAVAIAAGEKVPLLRSLGTLVAATGVVVGLAALGGVVLPQLHALADNAQITARTSPTLVDLAAATATGLAGAFAVARRDIGDILPGVAIAISLVPPLSVVGITAVEGDWGGALGAFVLFATNVLAMIVVGALVFGVLGVLRADDAATARQIRRGRVYGIVGAASVLIVAALAVSTLRTVQLSERRAAAQTIAERWALDLGDRLLTTSYEGDELVVAVEGDGEAAGDGELPLLLRGTLPAGTPIVVHRISGARRPAGIVP
jgi:uncharacterized hydrophobic protein (TIGR00271 family)